MKCKYCEINDASKYSKYSTGEFCSRTCARTYAAYVNRLETNKKVSLKLKGRKVGGALTNPFRSGYDSRRDSDEQIQKRHDSFKETVQKKTKFTLENAPFELLSKRNKRKVLLQRSNNCCSKCGFGDWMGNPLVLHVDHINGNHADDSESNLRILCPNCHSQTPTYCFNGRKHSDDCKKKISDKIKLKF